jgi:hypothetical protein
VLSSCGRHPGLIQAARDASGSARYLRQGRHRSDARGADVHRKDLPRTFQSGTTCICSGSSPTRRPRPAGRWLCQSLEKGDRAARPRILSS